MIRLKQTMIQSEKKKKICGDKQKQNELVETNSCTVVG